MRNHSKWRAVRESVLSDSWAPTPTISMEHSIHPPASLCLLASLSLFTTAWPQTLPLPFSGMNTLGPLSWCCLQYRWKKNMSHHHSSSAVSRLKERQPLWNHAELLNQLDLVLSQDLLFTAMHLLIKTILYTVPNSY